MIWSTSPRWRAAVAYARSMGAVPDVLPADTSDWEPWHRAAVEGADWFVRRDAARATTIAQDASGRSGVPEEGRKATDAAAGECVGLFGDLLP